MTDPALWIRLKETSPIPLDAELSCGAGELLVLIGPSGCGKSTILRSIAGLYRPRSGQVRCMGEDWYDTERNITVPAFRRHVGMVFQNYALFPHMTVQKNIMSAMHGLSDADKREKSLALLSRMKLDGLQDRMPRQLSGGQRQRTAVARALARDPRILLLDEPFSAVDKVVRHQLYSELKELQQSYAIPIVLVTHDFEEARLMGNKIVVINRGESLQEGSPLQVFTRPQSLPVARLLGARNLFVARIVRHDAGENATLLDWEGTDILAPMHDAFAPGEKVLWHVPPGEVALHPPGRDADGTLPNVLRGEVVRADAFPPVTRMVMRIDGKADRQLSVDAALQEFRTSRPGPGALFPVSVPFEAVHIMPYEENVFSSNGSL